MPQWLRDIIPIAALLLAVALVLWRLPQVDMPHSPEFRRRRFFNWFPLGMTYAFLYFGRYNINEATSALGHLTDNAAFGTIFGVGAAVYGISFLLNGPLTDQLGGRATILISAGGVALANALMGATVYFVLHGWNAPGGIVLWLTLLYALNMYFQSFGAVSIVKVNAAWFHVRERGVQGGVFGILISLGVYFGYDWSKKIVEVAPAYWAFFVPALILLTVFVVGFMLIRETPSHAGHADFDVGDASSHEGEHRLPVGQVFQKMLKNPVIMTIVAVEFCTGYLRNGVMSWYPKYSKSVGIADDFVATNWGMLLCVFGIVGGMFAGIISDRVFGSRRGPVVSVLYSGLTLGAVLMSFLISERWVGWVLVMMALNYVGVHGMLSGTASADFGGKKNAGVATGIIDGFVYAGTAFQSLLVARIIPQGADAKIAENWRSWPIAMIPIAIIGLVLCARLWNARPQRTAAH